jgi:hypothetical protein
MDQQFYKKAVADAHEAVKDVEDADLRKSGFEIILKQLLQISPAPTGGAVPHTDDNGISLKVNAGRANKTGLTDDEIQTLFEVKDKAVILKIQPSGTTVPEQQQTLAHAILVGHFALFGSDDISAKKMGAAARDWKLLDTNFSRTILVPGYIQSKGERASVRYSLKPGAMGKVKETLQKMAHGE